MFPIHHEITQFHSLSQMDVPYASGGLGTFKIHFDFSKVAVSFGLLMNAENTSKKKKLVK